MKYLLLFLLLFPSQTEPLTPKEIIENADNLYRGTSSYTEMTISIIRPKWSKEMKLKSWSKGSDYSVSVVLSPAKEKGTVFLMRDKEVYNYVPSIDRTIKLPPSMMMQNWMGTDLTNDDLVKQSSIVVDYNHELLAEETIEGYDCYKVKLTPKEDAAVVWGSIIYWIEKEHFMQMKVEFYDEDEFLVNKMTGSNVKTFGDRTLPSKMEFITEDKPGNKTIIEYTSWEFDIEISDSKFTKQNMKRIR